MIKDVINFVSIFLWSLFLFGIWVGMSLGQGTEGQWWSLFSFDSEKYGFMTLEISYIKIIITAFLSVIIAFSITKKLVNK